jgi:D-alanine-D-alanine ligase
MTQQTSILTPLQIAIVTGGTSAERSISLQSAENVALSLKARGHQIRQFDLQFGLPDDIRRCDIVLPMAHGTDAEDGTLQSQLDAMGVPWFGSSAAASRLTFDKAATRKKLEAAGLPIPPGQSFDATTSFTSVTACAAELGFPVVVKPTSQGSSVGVTIVSCDADLPAAVQSALQWGTSYLIERFIAGREITVPVVDDFVFPAVEILPARQWFDYEAKYEDDATKYCVNPSNISPAVATIALTACQTCGVIGISRTDLRIDSNGRPWILEINTIPGMTSHSLVPMSAAALGLSIGEIYEVLLRKQLGQQPQLPWVKEENHDP